MGGIMMKSFGLNTYHAPVVQLGMIIMNNNEDRFYNTRLTNSIVNKREA